MIGDYHRPVKEFFSATYFFGHFHSADGQIRAYPSSGQRRHPHPDDAVRMIAEAHCDAVMIGRAASSNPWIFRQIAQYLATGAYDQPGHQDRYQMMRTYYAMLVERQERDAAGKMKQFATYFTHGVTHGARLRADIYHAHEAERILELVDEFFSREVVAA